MDIECLLVGVAVALFVYLFNKHFIRVYDYWAKQGLPCVEGALPFFGNTLSILTLREGFGTFCDEIYRAHPTRSIVGFFQFREPHLLIRDPGIVKTVLLSDFASFHENGMSLDPAVDPLASRNPFFSYAEAWKRERSRLTVALMSSKKRKVLFGAVKNVCRKFSEYLESNVRTSNGSFETESKDLSSFFTGEVVASAGFGAEGDFFSLGSGPNSFREAVTGAFDAPFKIAMEQTVLAVAPALNKILRVSFIPGRTDRLFRRVVNVMIEARLKDGVARNDLLQILLDTMIAKDETIDLLQITASAAAFFLDGYETSAITLSFFFYQVAANPQVQDRLRDEVKTVLEKYDGEMTYEALGEMTYMDQALNESMRLYPALLFLEKRCTDKCRIVGSDGLECHVEPGTVMVVPVHALHNDPEYWENPEVFDPDRFSEENKKSRPKYAFLPFGEGPRICVGMRFAVLQIKAAVATMLRDWRVEVSPKTRVPVKLKPTRLLTAVEGGLWIKFKPL